MKALYIHIGPHKTGSTYLQKHVFPNINDFYYIGRFTGTDIIGGDSYYDFMQWVCLGQVKYYNRFVDWLSRDSHDKFLLSEEWLSSAFTGNDFPRISWIDKIRRIGMLVKHVDIIIFYYNREPAVTTHSLYRQLVSYGIYDKNMMFSKFLDSDDVDFYYYNNSKHILESIFGHNNVHELAYHQNGFDLSELEHILHSKILSYSLLKENESKIIDDRYEIKCKPVFIRKILAHINIAIPFLSRITYLRRLYRLTSNFLSINHSIPKLSLADKAKINERFGWRI